MHFQGFVHDSLYLYHPTVSTRKIVCLCMYLFSANDVFMFLLLKYILYSILNSDRRKKNAPFFKSIRSDWKYYSQNLMFVQVYISILIMLISLLIMLIQFQAFMCFQILIARGYLAELISYSHISHQFISFSNGW